MAKTRDRIQATLPVIFLKEGGMFVAYCPLLDLSTCGETFDEAKKNVGEALDIFFEECVRRGTLNEALGSLGWQKVEGHPSRWQPPLVVGEERLPVTIPAAA